MRKFVVIIVVCGLALGYFGRRFFSKIDVTAPTTQPVKPANQVNIKPVVQKPQLVVLGRFQDYVLMADGRLVKLGAIYESYLLSKIDGSTVYWNQLVTGRLLVTQIEYVREYFRDLSIATGTDYRTDKSVRPVSASGSRRLREKRSGDSDQLSDDECPSCQLLRDIESDGTD